jgi:hypothetical protein
MVQNLCLHYGVYINHIDNVPYHDIPTPEALAQDGVEEKLKELGFGYRAKYIAKTAAMVHERGLEWLEGLCNPEQPGFGFKEKAGAAGELMEDGREGYRHALSELQILSGVGPKVADCVCLFGLGWGEAVPVDTHGMSQFPVSHSNQLSSQILKRMTNIKLRLCSETHLHIPLHPTRMLTKTTSMANRPTRLQIRQRQTQELDCSDIHGRGQSFSRLMGEGGWMGTFSPFHCRLEELRWPASCQGRD